MDINKLNYELYFVDYHEGNLSTEQVAELMVFLEQHSDLKSEFEAFGDFDALNLDVEFSEKFSLKKTVLATDSINEHNAEDFLVAEAEGDLSVEDQTELNTFLDQNPFYKTDQEIYRKTKLQAPDVIFTDKASLKKPRIIPIWLQRAAAVVVASLIIGSGLYIFQPDGIAYEPRKTAGKLNQIIDPAENVRVLYGNLFEKGQSKNVAKESSVGFNTSTSAVSKDNGIANYKPRPSDNLSDQTNGSQTPLEGEENFSDEVALSEELETAESVEIIKSEKIEHFKTKSQYVSPVKAMSNFLKRRVLKDESSVVRSHLEGVELAQLSLESVNKVFGTNLYLHPTYNGEGEMLSFVIESNRFAIHRNVKRKKKDQQ